MNANAAQDDVLWAELRAVYDSVDPVPSGVTSVAYAALAFRTLEEDLARLASDSAEQLASLRSGEGPGRLVTFESDTLTIEVQVSSTGDERHLVGQLVPPAPAQVTIQSPDQATEVSADDLGRFSASHIAAGPVRLTCRRADQQPTVTSWLVI